MSTLSEHRTRDRNRGWRHCSWIIVTGAGFALITASIFFGISPTLSTLLRDIECIPPGILKISADSRYPDETLSTLGTQWLLIPAYLSSMFWGLFMSYERPNIAPAFSRAEIVNGAKIFLPTTIFAATWIFSDITGGPMPTIFNGELLSGLRQTAAFKTSSLGIAWWSFFAALVNVLLLFGSIIAVSLGAFVATQNRRRA